MESESVTYSGGYISDRVARSRRTKSLLYKLRLAAEQLNTECGWGVILAAAAPVPKQGPRAAGLELSINDKDGLEPQWSGGGVRRPEMSGRKKTLYSYPHSPLDVDRKLTPTKVRKSAERSILSNSFVSPFGLTLNQSLSAAEAPTMVTEDMDRNMNIDEESESQTISSIAVESLSPNSSQSLLDFLGPQGSSSQLLSSQGGAPSHTAGTESLYSGAHGSFQSNTESNPQQIAPSLHSLESVGSEEARNPALSQFKRRFFITPTVREHSTQSPHAYDDQHNRTNINLEQDSSPGTPSVSMPPFYREGLRTLGPVQNSQSPTASQNITTNQYIAPTTNQTSNPSQSVQPNILGSTLQTSKFQVQYNPLQHINISGLTSKDSSAVPDINLFLRPIICGICEIERKSANDKTYR